MKKIIFLLSLVTMLLNACASKTDPAEAYKGQTPQQIFAEGEQALRKKENSEAIKHYEALEIQYPYNENAETAQLHLIYAYYMKDEYALAVAAADRYIRVYPTSPYVDYAFYLRGVADYYQSLGVLERMFSVNMATRDLTQIQKAFADFSELTARFPQSKYAPAAHQYMIYLRNTIANHELGVAEYYYGRKAYVAAANRASTVVAHYQGAPAVVDALILMVKCYRELHMNKQEQDTRAVLHYNYPNVAVN
jgi:outer membrane protein assembly factor BamD